MAKKKAIYQIFAFLFTVAVLGSFLGLSLKSPQPSSMASSDTCKACHEEIYFHWKNGMHSMSLEDPIFKAAYMESYFNTAGEAKYACLPCHAPITLINRDFDLKQEITKEGVSCDFCHSIKNVNLANRDNRFEFETGKIKRGPLAKDASPAHETQASDLFKSSELCAACHEYTNDHGVSILGTYSEWKESSQAKEGIQCQNCHMPLVTGDIVKPNVKASTSKKINLHAISASHSTEQLQKALKIKIEDIYEENEVMQVTVAVTNVGSGHMVPTGIPSRKLILSVAIQTPNEHFHQQRTYQRILLDESGNEIKKECDVFLKSARVASDTRLRPKETRRERFVFVKPKNKKMTVTAQVEYLYKTNILQPTEIRVKMAEDVKTLSH